MLVWLTVWLILVPLDTTFADPRGSLFLIFSMHNVNVIIVAAELFLNGFRFVLTHAVFALYYLGIYMVFSWFFISITGDTCYFFIDWRLWVALPGYATMALLGGGSFAGMTLLSKRLKG